VNREVHAGFCGSRGVQFPPATRQLTGPLVLLPAFHFDHNSANLVEL
jgi:hypothetical protein